MSKMTDVERMEDKQAAEDTALMWWWNGYEEPEKERLSEYYFGIKPSELTRKNIEWISRAEQ